MKITLTNDYHNTSVTLRPTLHWAGRYYISPTQAKRAWHVLCGMKDCACSGDLGTRGPQATKLLLTDSDHYCVIND